MGFSTPLRCGNPVVTRQAAACGKAGGHIPELWGLTFPEFPVEWFWQNRYPFPEMGSNRDPDSVSGFGDGHTQIRLSAAAESRFFYLEDET